MTKIYQNEYINADAWAASGAYFIWGKATELSSSSLAGLERTASLKELSAATKANVWPLLMQRISIQYQRKTQPIYPINMTGEGLTQVTLLGAPSGALECQGIVGPATDISKLVEATGTACGAGVCALLQPFNRSCTIDTYNREEPERIRTTGSNRYLIKNLLLSTIGLTMDGSEMAVVGVPLTFTFTSLEML